MTKRKKKDERAFWTLDAETDPFKPWEKVEDQRIPKPFIWGLYTGAGMHFLNTVEDVIAAIKDQDVIVYAHNGGKFDFHLEDRTARLLDHINLREPLKIIDGRLVSAKIGRAEIRDSWNLLPAPLREFGSKLEIDYKKLEASERHKHMPEIKQYLAQDCVGLWDAINTFELKYGRHLTQAGAAMAQWQYLSGLPRPRSDENYFNKFQDYYYGGRVQCFQRGHLHGPVHVRDIRSAYPRAMLEDHPYDITYHELAYPRSVLGSDMVTVDCISDGALPFRSEKGAITFPTDQEKRRYYVTGWEYLAATETGTIHHAQLINAVRFSGLKNFKPYIHHFYNLRKQYRADGDEANTFFAKILMNSLYGKFGANPNNYGEFMCVPWSEKFAYSKGEQHWKDGDKDYRFNGKFGVHAVVRADLDDHQKHFINVATAASITGWVRAYLWRNICRSDDPVYCDTDCIMARGFSPDMQMGSELGQWADEGTADELWIAGKKLYYLKGKFDKGKTEKAAAKGVRPDASMIKAAAEGLTVTVRSQAPTFSLKGKRPVYFQERRIRMTG